jgi:hypothetical protein
MTQRTYLTSAVLSVATGQILAPLDLVFDLMHDIAGDGISPAQAHVRFAEIRAELIRQLPWLEHIEIPDFRAAKDPCYAQVGWTASVAVIYGSTQTIEVGTLTPALAVPAGVRLVRLAR